MVNYLGAIHAFEYLGVKVAAEEVTGNMTPLWEYSDALQWWFKRKAKKMAIERMEQLYR